jgi:hypothetical protein
MILRRDYWKIRHLHVESEASLVGDKVYSLGYLDCVTLGRVFRRRSSMYLAS